MVFSGVRRVHPFSFVAFCRSKKGTDYFYSGSQRHLLSIVVHPPSLYRLFTLLSYLLTKFCSRFDRLMRNSV